MGRQQRSGEARARARRNNWAWTRGEEDRRGGEGEGGREAASGVTETQETLRQGRSSEERAR